MPLKSILSSEYILFNCQIKCGIRSPGIFTVSKIVWDWEKQYLEISSWDSYANEILCTQQQHMGTSFDAIHQWVLSLFTICNTFWSLYVMSDWFQINEDNTLCITVVQPGGRGGGHSCTLRQQGDPTVNVNSPNATIITQCLIYCQMHSEYTVSSQLSWAQLITDYNTCTSGGLLDENTM